jgi:alpha/beta superfamily hydrolase
VTFPFPCAETFAIPGPAGALEALATCPTGVARAATGVICHPHPQHGGTMHNKVVHTLARAFNDLGAPALRFNFRGVGASAGSFDQGRGELADLRAVADWARARRPHDALWLAGFSFGALIALHAAEELGAAQLVTVAPAVHRLEGREPVNPRCPWLLVMGEDDEVVPPQSVRDWLAGLEHPPTSRWLPGVGHFFHQRLPELRAVLEESLRPRLE